jgi:hypothetical protein
MTLPLLLGLKHVTLAPLTRISIGSFQVSARAPSDKASGEKAAQDQVFVSGGEAIQPQEGLKAEAPIPRPNRSRHGALSSSVQTRRHKAASEAAITDSGEEAPEKKRRQRWSQAPVVPCE